MDKLIIALVIAGLIITAISGFALIHGEQTIVPSHSNVSFATQFYDKPVAETIIIPLDVYKESIQKDLK